MNPLSVEHPEQPEFVGVLELPPLFSLEDVKIAYRQKVMRVHPDRGGQVADFLRVQGAYERALEYLRIRGDGRGWIALHTRRYVPQQKVAQEVRRRGGEVDIEEFDWIERSFGEGFGMLSARLRAIRLRGPAADDAFLEHLDKHRAGLAYLLELDLAGGRVTDAGLPRLAGLELLRHLDLARSGVSVRGLRPLLGTLPSLQSINLARTKVGWLARRRLGWAYPQLKVAT